MEVFAIRPDQFSIRGMFSCSESVQVISSFVYKVEVGLGLPGRLRTQARRNEQ